MLFFKKKFFPIKTTIFVHKENSYYTMNHTVEDLSLFNALRQGDGNSFDHLFRRYYPMLCAYAHRLVSLEDAEEIVQEVMLWLWENRGDLIIESSLNQSFVQNDLSEGLEPLDAGTGENQGGSCLL